MNTVLVTGGTGLIGRFVVRQLLSGQRPVRLLVRNRSLLDPETLRHCEVAEGDIRDAGAVRRAVQQVDTVIHLAACARAWSPDPDAFAAINVAAVGQLLEQAEAAGVRRFAHVSTSLTLLKTAAGRRLTPYEESKLIGEGLVANYVARGGDAVILHPTRVFGPGPLNDANGVTRLISLYLRLPLVPRLADRDVLGNYVHADDVATGIVLAAERGRRGAHYVLGGENVSIREFLDLVGAIGGRRRRTIEVPRWLALAGAAVAEVAGRIAGNVVITRDWIRCYLEDQRLDAGPSWRELGFRPRSLTTAIGETIQWLRQRSEPLPA